MRCCAFGALRQRVHGQRRHAAAESGDRCSRCDVAACGQSLPPGRQDYGHSGAAAVRPTPRARTRHSSHTLPFAGTAPASCSSAARCRTTKCRSTISSSCCRPFPRPCSACSSTPSARRMQRQHAGRRCSERLIYKRAGHGVGRGPWMQTKRDGPGAERSKGKGYIFLAPVARIVTGSCGPTLAAS